MKEQSSGPVRVTLLLFVFVRVSGCDKSVSVGYPRGVFRYIEPDDVALSVDTACLCRNHVCPWKVDGSELALSEQEAMSLIRRVNKETDDFAGAINVTSVGPLHIAWQIKERIIFVLDLVGVELSWSREPYASDNPAVLCDSVVHGATYGEGFVCAVLIHVPVHCTAPGNRKIAILVVVAAHDLTRRL